MPSTDQRQTAAINQCVTSDDLWQSALAPLPIKYRNLLGDNYTIGLVRLHKNGDRFLIEPH
jgi:hypothetical protein